MGSVMRGLLRNTIIIGLFVLYFIMILMKSDLGGNLLSPVVTAIAAWYLYLGYVKKAAGRTMRAEGVFFFASVFTWVVCDTAWAVYSLLLGIDPEEMILTTYGYSLTNLFFLIWLIISGLQELKRWNMVQVLVDTVAISFSSMILNWVSAASIGIDFIIIIWTIIWFFSIRSGKIPRYMRYSPLGTILFALMDIVYYYQLFYTEYDPNSLLDGGYVFAFALMGISGYLKYVQKEQGAITLDNKGGNSKGLILLVAPVAIVLFKGFEVEYLLLLVVTILLHFMFSAFTQKNIFRDELLEKEKELNAKLERKVAERTSELNALLDKDVVTGLQSRRSFLRNLRETIGELDDQSNLILFYIDLNRYKMIKTMFGNYVGEQVLSEVGATLQTRFEKDGAMLASYGEDVFVLLLKGNFTYEKGEAIAAEITETCSRIYRVDGYDIRVTLNTGLAIYPTDSSTKAELIRHADIGSTSSMENAGWNYDFSRGVYSDCRRNGVYYSDWILGHGTSARTVGEVG